MIYTIFSEDSEVGCLCTFPHNNAGKLDADSLRSLAYLGAAIALIKDKALVEEENYFCIPRDIPDWVVEGIETQIKEHGKNKEN